MFIREYIMYPGVGKLKLDGSCQSCGGGGGGGGGTVVTLSLPDNAMTRVDIPSTDMQGSYLFIVKSTDPDGATAVFSASSARNNTAGSIARITSSPAIGGEEIQLDWQANEVPQLYHSVLRTVPVPELVEYTVNIRQWM
jgi:hypothetical protein